MISYGDSGYVVETMDGLTVTIPDGQREGALAPVRLAGRNSSSYIVVAARHSTVGPLKCVLLT